MKSTIAAILLASLTLQPASADIFDFFRRKKPVPSVKTTAALGRLSEEQVVRGLKEALAKGAQQAVASLSKPNGFLKDAQVKIPMPENLQRVEKTLRTLRQNKFADDFVTTMNRAAEKATPQAGAVLVDAVKQMSIADAKSILTGTNNAATAYFRRTSETNLFARFHPIVKQATEETGVTRAYKAMTAKAGLGGGFASSFLNKDTLDIDSYVTDKALDGLFLKIAEQEKLIRANPVARTTDLLKEVFGAVTAK